MAGASNLFTQEFFSLAASHLDPDNGMFLQWLQIYELAPERIGSILKTFRSVFPHVYVFTAHPDSNDLLLVGSNAPVHLDWARLTARFAAWSDELTRAELHSPYELAALLLAGNDELTAIADTTPLNTDDNAFIEFGAPKDLLAYASEDADLPWLSAARGKRGRLVQRMLGDEEEWPRHAVALAQAYIVGGSLADGLDVIESAREGIATATSAVQTEARRLYEIATFLDGDTDEVEPVDPTAMNDAAYVRALTLARSDARAALTDLTAKPELTRENPAYGLLYGYLLYQSGRYDDAGAVLARADEVVPDADQSPAIAYYRARAAYAGGSYAKAVSQMNRYRASLTRSLSASASGD
jgi:tetratricopeptide (TPR) repeat protein